jgi:hypothetical protein
MNYRIYTSFLSLVLLILIGCQSNPDVNPNRKDATNQRVRHSKIIAHPVQFTQLISEARRDSTARQILMQHHMEMMKSPVAYRKNPEMKKAMQAHMLMMMEDEPMVKEMRAKMFDQIVSTEEGRKWLIEQMHENDKVKELMKKRMKAMMQKDPQMMKEMMGKNSDSTNQKDKSN